MTTGIKFRLKKLTDPYLTLTTAVVTTGWLYVSVNVALWQAGGAAKVPDLMVSVVCSREGLGRRRAPRHSALLHPLLLTSLLPEETTSQPDFQGSNLEDSSWTPPESRTDCVCVLLEGGARHVERCMACQRCPTHRCLSSAVSAAYTHTHRSHDIASLLLILRTFMKGCPFSASISDAGIGGILGTIFIFLVFTIKHIHL